jgi:hypothetical protein
MPLQVGGLTYWEIKCRALNGGRSKLDAEQLGFVGIVDVDDHRDVVTVDDRRSWSPATIDARIAEAEEELARLRDIAPGWIRLARELVKDEE